MPTIRHRHPTTNCDFNQCKYIHNILRIYLSRELSKHDLRRRLGYGRRAHRTTAAVQNLHTVATLGQLSCDIFPGHFLVRDFIHLGRHSRLRQFFLSFSVLLCLLGASQTHPVATFQITRRLDATDTTRDTVHFLRGQYLLVTDSHRYRLLHFNGWLLRAHHNQVHLGGTRYERVLRQLVECL